MPELISGGTTVPIMRPLPRMLEASWLGTKPACSIASRTFARVSGETMSGLDSARDTVIGATPTRLAISRTPRRCGDFFLPGTPSDFPAINQLRDTLFAP